MSGIHYKIHYFLRSNINDLYIVGALRSFALSLIAIFVPIYLLQRDFSLMQVMIFLLTTFIFQIIMSYYSLKRSHKKGIKQSFFIGVPFTILFFIGLYNIETLVAVFGKLVSLALLGLASSVSLAFYWTSYHVEFARFSKKKNFAKQLGIMNVLSVIASVIAPLIGALVISIFSYDALFAIVIFVLVLALIPLIFSKDDYESFDFEFDKALAKKYKNYVFPFFSQGLSFPATAYYWPILLFLIFTSIPKMGGIYTVSNALLVITAYFVGHKLTDKNTYRILKLGTILHGISVIVRGFVKDFTALVFIQGLGGISNPLIEIPFKTKFYESTKNKGITTSILLMETYLGLGRIASVLLLMVLLLLFSITTSLVIMLVFSGIVVQGMNTIKN